MHTIARRLNLHAGFVMPAYGHESIAEVAPTIEQLLGCTPAEQTLPMAWFPNSGYLETVILCIVDGLGYYQFNASPILEDLRKLGRTRTVTSLFPSTTPVCFTSLLTGGTSASLGIGDFAQYVPPEEFLDGRGRLTKLIPFTSGGRSLREFGFAPENIFHGSTLCERLAHVGKTSVVLSPYVEGAYADQAQRGATERIFSPTAESLVSNLVKVMERPNRPNLVVVYYPDVDVLGHKYGPDSPEQLQAIQNFASLLTELCRSAITDSGKMILLLTADHGQMSADTGSAIYLDLPEFAWLGDRLPSDGAGGVAPLVTWSRRCPALYIRPELVKESVGRLRHQLSGYADVLRVTDALAAGLYGPPESVSSRFLGRAGTVLILPHDGYCVWTSGNDKKGTHGGLMPQEMYVPFFTALL